MSGLKLATTCIFFAGIACACTTANPRRAPETQPIASADDFTQQAQDLRFKFMQFGDSINAVENGYVMISGDDGNDAACTNPPRPNSVPPFINPQSLQLAIAAIQLISENEAAGSKTRVEKCRPVQAR